MPPAHPIQSFLNPSDHLPDPANQHVQALLDSVIQAQHHLGRVTPHDYQSLRPPLAQIRKRLRADPSPHRLTHLVEAHVRATVAASLRTHCLTAFPWQAALQAAKRYDAILDHHRNATLWDQLPLLGLVFSVKDCIHVQGHPTTLGCSSRVHQLEPDSAWIVTQLQNNGAILLARTACPQAMVSNVTHSPLWGTVRSPLDPDHFQVGGSSGGEAALVAMGGTALGLATDMGGSVRQPAALSELVGLKFASTSFPFRQGNDFATGLPETEVPATACGMLACHLDTVEDVCAALRLFGETSQGEEGERARLAVSTCEASPEVASVLDRFATSSSKLGEVADLPDLLGDGDEWSAMWIRQATSHGLQQGMELVGSDPLIPESMFATPPPVPTPLSPTDRSATDASLAHLVSGFTSRLDSSSSAFLLCPSYALGGPTKTPAFHSAARTAELWLQAVNLLDWVSISLPLELDPDLRARWRDVAEAEVEPEPGAKDESGSSRRERSGEIGRVWAEVRRDGLPVASADEDVWCEDGGGRSRLPSLSVQLVARPGHEQGLLRMARRAVETARGWR